MNTATRNTGTLVLSIDGMTCGHCIQAVTRAIAAVPGARARSVSIGAATIEADDDAAHAVIAALNDAGYSAKVASRPVTEPVATAAKSGGGCCGGPKGCCG
jgi:copper chaperone CopZ